MKTSEIYKTQAYKFICVFIAGLLLFLRVKEIWLFLLGHSLIIIFAYFDFYNGSRILTRIKGTESYPLYVGVSNTLKVLFVITLGLASWHFAQSIMD